jgi:hypothetical protein
VQLTMITNDTPLSPPPFSPERLSCSRSGEHMGDAQSPSPVDRPCGRGETFAELALLLPNWQMEALEREASRRGQTMGQLLRRLIHNCLGGLNDTRLPSDPALPDAAADRSRAAFFRDNADGDR